MTRPLQFDRLDIRALAQEGEPVAASTPLQKLDRLAGEAQSAPPDALIEWQAHAELRESAGAEADVWLRLQAATQLALTCQRCMHAVATRVEFDQWYRFVASEDIAMAEDDQSEEDLLVMEPHFNLLSLLEDELLMALPLVPMHTQCPQALPILEGIEVPALQAEKPNPFAVLAKLKKH